MKLRQKFSFLVIWIGAQSVLLAAALVIGYNWVIGIKNYQYELSQTQFVYRNVSAFTDSVDARGIEMDTMGSDWARLVESCKQNFSTLLSDPMRHSLFDSELVSLTDNIEGIWNGLAPQLDALSKNYTTIANTKMSDMFKNTVRTSGFNQAIINYSQTEDVRVITQEMRDVRDKVALIYYSNETLNTIIEQLSHRLSERSASISSFINIVALILSAVSAIIVVIIVRLTTVRLISRIDGIHNLSSKLAARDLTVRAFTKEQDELGDLIADLNNTLSQLNDFFNVMKYSSLRSENAGQAINRYARNAAKASSAIDGNIEEMTALFENLSGAVLRSIGSINQMTEISKVLIENNAAQSVAIGESHTAVSEITATLEDISAMAREKAQDAQEMQDFVNDGDEKVSATNNLLAQINSQLDEVSEVVTIINAIAEQTNLLSMNAAIESAHAGDAGKGFGVVAEEIRVLADSTGENAQRISNSIYTIIDKVRQANTTAITAAEAFTKVSVGVKGMLSALMDISSGIETIDEKTAQLYLKTNEISESAQKIDTFSNRLSDQQTQVSTEISSMQNVFAKSVSGIAEIRIGTADIVKRMDQVNLLSSENCQKMVELVCQLEEFKTIKPKLAKRGVQDLPMGVPKTAPEQPVQAAEPAKDAEPAEEIEAIEEIEEAEAVEELEPVEEKRRKAPSEVDSIFEEGEEILPE